jgi:hypothetical protein
MLRLTRIHQEMSYLHQIFPSLLLSHADIPKGIVSLQCSGFDSSKLACLPLLVP